MFSKAVMQTFWSGFTFILGIYIPKIYGVDAYGEFIGLMAVMAVVCSVFNSLIIQRVYSVSVTADISILLRALQLFAIGYFLVIFISFFLLKSSLVTSNIILFYGLSFIGYDFSKRLWLLLENYKHQLILEILCKWGPLILLTFFSVKMSLFLLIISSGNIIYMFYSIRSVWIRIEKPKLLLVDLHLMHRDIVQGSSLLLFNTQASVYSLIYVRVISYYFGLREVGAFFAIKNIFSVISPISQYTELTLSRSI